MYLCLKNPHIPAEILNNDLDKNNAMGNTWKTEFNERKTELMNITRNKTHQFQSLNFGRTISEDTHSHKHLGIIFQNNCKLEIPIKLVSWFFEASQPQRVILGLESHIKMLIAKCRCQVACLTSFKCRLSRKALETMYRSFILPQLDYAERHLG